MNRDLESDTANRLYPMQKKTGYVPVIQRYSAEFPKEVNAFRICYLGIQGPELSASDRDEFIDTVSAIFKLKNGPVLFDFARFEDPQSFDTIFATAYWQEPEAYKSWLESSEYRNWWNDTGKDKGTLGYFRESIEVSKDKLETIAFKDYISGLSACPMHKVKPIEESGYWGAARDRIPASAFDKLESPMINNVPKPRTQTSTKSRLRMRPPKNFVVIRSGVSWEDCGEEQFSSYEKNLKPKLDLGMEFLRQNPVESGCLNMRQVSVIDSHGNEEKESFCLGYFASLHHLETWSKNHPTHLAIYGRAQQERKKYMDKLELRTFHEVYVVDRDADMEYINCHPQTGLIPYFEPV